MNINGEMSSWLSRCHDNQTLPNHRSAKRIEEPSLLGVGVTLDSPLSLLGPVMSNFSDEENEDDDDEDIIGSLLDTCQDEGVKDSTKTHGSKNDAALVPNQASGKLLFIKANSLDEDTKSRCVESCIELNDNNLTFDDVNTMINGHDECIEEDMEVALLDTNDDPPINSSNEHDSYKDTDPEWHGGTTLNNTDDEDPSLVETIEHDAITDESWNENENEKGNVTDSNITKAEIDKDMHALEPMQSDSDPTLSNAQGHGDTNDDTVDSKLVGIKRRKRKQHKPRCLKYTMYDSESEYSDSDSVNVNGWSSTDDAAKPNCEIKKEPFCSKLRKPKKERTKGVAVPNTKCTDIWSIINRAFEDNISDEPNVVTYPYVHEDEATTHQESFDKLSTKTNSKNDCIIVVEPESPDNESTNEDEGKFREATSEDFVCNICQKSFDDPKTFASHYVSHSMFEKERAFLNFGGLEGSQFGASDRKQKKHTSSNREVKTSCEANGVRSENKHKPVDIKIKREPDESMPSIPLFKGLWESLDLSQFKTSGPLSSVDMSSSIPVSDSITYFCHVCNKKFTNILDLQRHVTDHDSQDTDEKGDSSSEHNYSPNLKSPLTGVGSLVAQSRQSQGDHKNSNSKNDSKSHTSDNKYLQGDSKTHSTDHPYTCHTCNKTFRDKTRLTTHVRVHTGEKPYHCHVCFKSFSQKGNLKLHQKIHTGEKDCHCSICRHSFRSKSDLNRHLKVHRADTSAADDKDSSSMEALSSSRQSTPSMDESQSPVVETPLEVFLRRDNRPASIRPSTIRSILEENDLPVHPSIALLSTKSETLSLAQLENLELLTAASSKTFNFLEPLKQKAVPKSGQTDKSREHKTGNAFERSVKDWLPLKPEEKNLMLSIDNEVEFIKAMTHAKTASEEDSKSHAFPCPLCNASLTSYDSLNHHILAIHGPLMSPLYPPLRLLPSDGYRDKRPASSPTMSPKKLYRCQECKMEFSSFTVFQCHLKTHSDSPQHKRSEEKCLICGQYVNLGDLGEHMMAHAIEKTYKCEFCMKVFRRSHHLQTHLRTHTGDRPYICLECNKRFSRGDHLQNHKRTHTGEKPYQCDICYKTYSQSHHLLRHKRTHTGERPYKCIMCDKTFSRDHHLKKHMETHKVLMFTDQAPDIPLQKPTSSKPQSSTSRSYTSTSTGRRSLDHLINTELQDGAHGLGPVLMENSASRLMERLVKKRMEEDRKDGQIRQGNFGSEILGMAPSDKRGDDVSDDVRQLDFMSASNKGRVCSKLKIADLLADVDSQVPAEISSKLVANHLIKIAHRSKVVVDGSNNQADDITEMNRPESSTSLDMYHEVQKVVVDDQADFSDFAQMFGSSGEEKMTLEDVVNRKLMQEYGLII